VDANEHGSSGYSDSEMEVVGETPNLWSMNCVVSSLIIYFCLMSALNKIMVWNCRGAANTSFYRYCKHYVVSYKPVMLVIVEIRCDSNKLQRTFSLLGYDGFIATNVEGFSGGLERRVYESRVAVQKISIHSSSSLLPEWYKLVFYAYLCQSE
jgi:hypothetical protein